MYERGGGWGVVRHNKIVDIVYSLRIPGFSVLFVFITRHFPQRDNQHRMDPSSQLRTKGEARGEGDIIFDFLRLLRFGIRNVYVGYVVRTYVCMLCTYLCLISVI